MALILVLFSSQLYLPTIKFPHFTLTGPQLGRYIHSCNKHPNRTFPSFQKVPLYPLCNHFPLNLPQAILIIFKPHICSASITFSEINNPAAVWARWPLAEEEGQLPPKEETSLMGLASTSETRDNPAQTSQVLFLPFLPPESKNQLCQILSNVFSRSIDFFLHWLYNDCL